MIDYRINNASSDPKSPGPKTPGPEPEERRHEVLRPALWVLLAISIVGNAVTSFAGGVVLHGALGACTAVCAVGLIVTYFRRR